MYRLDNGVGLCRQKAVHKVRAGDWLRLRAPVALELGPDTSERAQRPVFVQRKPNFVAGFGSGAYSAKLFSGTRHRFTGFNHPRQCGEDALRIFVTRGPPGSGRWRHAPAHHDQFTFVTSVPNDGGGIVRKEAGHRRKIADVPIHDAEQRANSFLVRGDRV
jgi:hypothetical protein